MPPYLNLGFGIELAMELVRHFPETPVGFQEATALADELTKKRMFI
jgi:hypothetical protein